MPLYTYQEADNVLLLVKGDKGGIKAKKVKASEARSNRQEELNLLFYDAGTYVLSAAEINAYLKDNKNVLTFTPDSKQMSIRSQRLLLSLKELQQILIITSYM